MPNPAAESRAATLLDRLSSLTTENWERVRLNAPKADSAYGVCQTDQIELLAFKDGRHAELEAWVERAVTTVPTLTGDARLTCFSAAVTAMSGIYCADLIWPELLRSAYAPVAIVIPIDTVAADLDLPIPDPAPELWERFLQRVSNLTDDLIDGVARSREFEELAFGEELLSSAARIEDTLLADAGHSFVWIEAQQRLSAPQTSLDGTRSVFRGIGRTLGWSEAKTATSYAHLYAGQEAAFQRALRDALMSLVAYEAVPDGLVAGLYLPFEPVIHFKTLDA